MWPHMAKGRCSCDEVEETFGWGEYPGSARWPQRNHKGPYKKAAGGSEADRSSVRKTCVPALALQMAEGATGQGMGEALGAGNDKKMDYPLAPPEESTADPLILGR